MDRDERAGRPRGVREGVRPGRAAPAFLVFVLALLVLPASALAQTGLFFDEFAPTARTGAMGQAFTAIADDSSAAYYNPAGLGYAEQETILGFRYVKPRTRIDFDGDPIPQPPFVTPTTVDTDTNFDPPSTRGMVIGIAGALPHESLVDDFPILDHLRWGVIMFLGMPEQNTFNTFSDRTEPYFYRYDTRPDLISVAASLSLRITDWLSIGGGAIPNVNSFQTTDVRIRTNAPPDDPTRGADFATEQEAVATVAPVFGLMLKLPVDHLHDLLVFGMSYRGEIGNFFGTGDVLTEIGTGNPDGSFDQEIDLPPGFIVNYAGYAPAQWSFGLSSRPMERLRLAFDLVYKRWDRFATFIEVPPQPPFENAFVYRFGGEWTIPQAVDLGYVGTFRQLDVRFGYYFEESPNPTLNEEENILDTDQHVVSAGLGFGFDLFDVAEVRLDTIFQVHILTDRYSANEGDLRRNPYTIDGEVWNIGGDVRVGW